MRCFIAAWPDTATRLALSAVLDAVRPRVAHRRATRIDDVHLTLAFMADLADDEAQAVAHAVSSMQFEAFDWQLDRLGLFPQAGVVWAGARDELSAPLIELASRARILLDQLNIDYDRRALMPHVTLMRGVRRFDAGQIAPPIIWRIDAIALYRSGGGQSGARYSRVVG